MDYDQMGYQCCQKYFIRYDLKHNQPMVFMTGIRLIYFNADFFLVYLFAADENQWQPGIPPQVIKY